MIEGVAVTGRSGTVERAGDVLIVDDNENLRTLVRATLEGAGYRVVEAADGAEALWCARTKSGLALVLLDLDMPVLNGLGFAAAYRAGPAPHVPIVVMSASLDGAHIAARLGAAGYLQKPFSIRALLNMVAGFVAVTAPV